MAYSRDVLGVEARCNIDSAMRERRGSAGCGHAGLMRFPTTAEAGSEPQIAFAQQDRYTLKVPDGLAFSVLKGYDTRQDVAVSETKGSDKAILGNPTMIRPTRKVSRTTVSLSPKVPRL